MMASHLRPALRPKDRPVIAVDMDEVLADALGEHLTRYNAEFGEAITLDELHGRTLWEIVPHARLHALETYIRSHDFFAGLKVMPESQRVLERLQTRYDVYIATAAMEIPNSFTAKFDWLHENFPFIQPAQIVFCGDKAILAADYLIDDNPRQLRRFRGEGILYSAPANAFVQGFRRVRDWLDVERLFLDED